MADKKNLRVVALGALIFAGILLSQCTKPEDPAQPHDDPTEEPTDTVTPVNPNDTITPVNPGDTITPTPGTDTIIPGPGGDTIVPPTPGGDTIVPGTGGKVVNFYYDGGDNFPSLDTVRRYVNDPEYDSIYIKWVVSNAAYWTPYGFHVARDSLSKRFNISPKVYGGWWVVPYQIVPDADSLSHGVKGMARCDSVWYADRHYNVWPVNKSAQPPRYNGNRVLKAGRSR